MIILKTPRNDGNRGLSVPAGFTQHSVRIAKNDPYNPERINELRMEGRSGLEYVKATSASGFPETTF